MCRSNITLNYCFENEIRVRCQVVTPVNKLLVRVILLL